MKIAKLLIFLFIFITPALAIQSHPISQLGVVPEDRDADLNLSSYDIYLEYVRGYTGSRSVSLIEQNSNLYGLNLGSGGLTCTFCIDSSDIASGSIINSKIAANSINNTQLQGNSVTSNKIVDGTITSSDIGTGAVGSNEIINGAVNAVDISDNAVNESKIKSIDCPAGEGLTGIGGGNIRCSQMADPNAITGTGTSGYVAVFNETKNIENSEIFQDSSNNIGIGKTNPGSKFDVNGDVEGSNLVTNNCIKNSTGHCKITFDGNGNVIINI